MPNRIEFHEELGLAPACRQFAHHYESLVNPHFSIM
jgi:hypothetical protein